jgi:hypothetical protein
MEVLLMATSSIMKNFVISSKEAFMITYNENDKEISFDSWKDVVKRYPAQWVVFDKVDFDGARVNAGHIWVILPDEEIIDFKHKNRGKIVLSLRTTETMNMGGYIHGELINA